MDVSARGGRSRRAGRAAAAAAPPSARGRGSFFGHAHAVYVAAAVLRAALLAYGLWQDAHSAVKYTDIDYLVFTDAARAVWRGQSPYARETYRYTPLLAWLLAPTAAAGGDNGTAALLLFSAGKVLFAAADVVAGWLLVQILAGDKTGPARAAARAYASVWLLNPMVAAISTRGSSEGLLAVLVAALLWAVLARRLGLAAVLLGVAVHFKIYPFIYAPAIVWWMDDEHLRPADDGQGRGKKNADAGQETVRGLVGRTPAQVLAGFATPARLRFALISLATFFALNTLMYSLYGFPFVQHTFLHHVSRLDHRHNFSPYNMQLYLSSASSAQRHSLLPRAESLAFVPQLLLCTVLIPLVMAKKDLAATMLAQTFCFVAFNKVCTSQYFLWYMVFLPLYLPRSSFLRGKSSALGLAAAAAWIVTQALWLQQAFRLEFLGESTFVPGLWLTSISFFLVNCWILGIIIGDIAIEGG